MVVNLDPNIDLDDLIDDIKNSTKQSDNESNILNCLAALKEYQQLDKENRLIKTNLPLGTIVYVCLIEKDMSVFNIDQKAFVTGTVYFDAINRGYGKVVFDNVIDAITCVNNVVGLEKCIDYYFPTIDNDGVIHDNGSRLLDMFKSYDRRLDDNFFKNVIHTEVPEDVIINKLISSSGINLNTNEKLSNAASVNNSEENDGDNK